MAKKPRFGQRTWHFSDAGTKFDGRPRPTRQSTLKPISPALKRGVIHCSRCGNRVVSNVDNCPFCGCSLRPVYARFWFWLIIVVLVGVAVVALVNLNLPEESTAPTSPATPDLPTLLNGPEDSSLKELTLGTTIDNSGLLVTVDEVSTGPLAANGSQIYVVEVSFINQMDEPVNLYSTQWMLEIADNTRLDTFVGTAVDGTTIASNFEAYELAAHGSFNGRLYFALTPAQATEEEVAAGIEPEVLLPQKVIYQPSALAYSEDLLVTWKVTLPDAAGTS